MALKEVAEDKYSITINIYQANLQGMCGSSKTLISSLFRNLTLFAVYGHLQ